MSTQKIAITVPIKIIELIDDISKKKRMSRSKYITTVLNEQILKERNQNIKDIYDRIFSDDTLSREQLETANWFEGSGNKEGLEW